TRGRAAAHAFVLRSFRGAASHLYDDLPPRLSRASPLFRKNATAHLEPISPRRRHMERAEVHSPESRGVFIAVGSVAGKWQGDIETAPRAGSLRRIRLHPRTVHRSGPAL